MSSTEFMMGKLRLVEPRENETIDQLKVRLWTEMGNNPEEFEYGGFELSDDIGYVSLDQYIQLKGKIYEIFDYVSSDSSDSCEITKNDDGTFSFTAVYYTGNTSAQEMIAYTLADMID